MCNRHRETLRAGVCVCVCSHAPRPRSTGTARRRASPSRGVPTRPWCPPALALTGPSAYHTRLARGVPAQYPLGVHIQADTCNEPCFPTMQASGGDTERVMQKTMCNYLSLRATTAATPPAKINTTTNKHQICRHTHTQAMMGDSQAGANIHRTYHLAARLFLVFLCLLQLLHAVCRLGMALGDVDLDVIYGAVTHSTQSRHGSLTATHTRAHTPMSRDWSSTSTAMSRNISLTCTTAE